MIVISTHFLGKQQQPFFCHNHTEAATVESYTMYEYKNKSVVSARVKQHLALRLPSILVIFSIFLFPLLFLFPCHAKVDFCLVGIGI